MSKAHDRFALEVQAPFSLYIATGLKTVETRSYALPNELLGRRILLCESVQGTAMVSNITGDAVLAGQDGLQIIGEIVINKCVEYKSSEEWEQDRDKHMVPVSSLYDWSPTPDGRRWGWFIETAVVYDKPKSVPAMKRSFRSLFGCLSEA